MEHRKVFLGCPILILMIGRKITPFDSKTLELKGFQSIDPSSTSTPHLSPDRPRFV